MTLSIKKNLEEVQKDMSYVSDHLPKAPILFDINDSLKTVNELSKGLGLAIADKGLAENYNDILNLQNSAQEKVCAMKDQLNLGLEKMDTVSRMTAPISAKIAEVGLLATNVKNYSEFNKINNPFLESTIKTSCLLIDTLKEQQTDIISGLEAIKTVSDLGNFVKDETPSLDMISSGLTEVVRSMPSFPYETDFPSLDLINKKTLISEPETEKHQEKLDSILMKIDPVLIEYRQGCWEVFNKKGKDYIGQSSSSMRRLVDNLIRNIAPNEEVVETEYFKKNSSAKTKSSLPSRKAKIYYIIDYDKKKTKHLQRQAKGFLELYDNLPASDHKPIEDDQFIHGVFITIEGCLLSLLSEWNK